MKIYPFYRRILINLINLSPTNDNTCMCQIAHWCNGFLCSNLRSGSHIEYLSTHSLTNSFSESVHSDILMYMVIIFWNLFRVCPHYYLFLFLYFTTCAFFSVKFVIFYSLFHFFYYHLSWHLFFPHLFLNYFCTFPIWSDVPGSKRQTR